MGGRDGAMRGICWSALMGVLFFAATASAQIELGGGYSNLKLDGADNNLKDANGFGLDLRAGGPLILQPLRVSFDFGWRQYATTGSGLSIDEPNTSDLNIFSADVLVGWRQPVGPFFIEPEIAAGVLVGAYSTNNHFDASSFSTTNVGWSIRPGVAVGVHLLFFTAGIEGNYRWGNLDLGNGVGGGLREWYAGAFVGISFS